MASKSNRSGNTPEQQSRQARIADMRRADKARDRRNKAIAITTSGVVVAGLVGFGAWVLIEQKETERREKAAAETARKTPVDGEQT